MVLTNVSALLWSEMVDVVWMLACVEVAVWFAY